MVGRVHSEQHRVLGNMQASFHQMLVVLPPLKTTNTRLAKVSVGEGPVILRTALLPFSWYLLSLGPCISHILSWIPNLQTSVYTLASVFVFVCVEGM